MVSIIIVSYNTKELLRSCLTSIYQYVNDSDFEVIVVDNASSDKTVSMVKDEFKKVQVIESKENLGFGKACNKGAEAAKGNYVVFLNSDTSFNSDIITSMVHEFKNGQNIGVVGGILESVGKTTSQSFGKSYNLFNIFLLLTGLEKLRTKVLLKKSMQVDWVSGGCMMVQKALFNNLKGFDEHFFMYMEDVDLCYRVKKMGYRVVVDSSVQLSHVGQGSSNRGFAIVEIYKGLLYFYKKHKNTLEYFVLKFLLTAKAITAIIFGKITKSSYLVTTYTKALEYSL